VAKVRRTEYLFIYREDGTFLDIPTLLRGCAEVAPLRRTLGVSMLAGEEYPLSPAEVRVLVDTPSDRWVEADAVDGDAACVFGLVGKGLLLSDEPDGDRAELRRRDECLSSGAWNIYAALYHLMTRWRDVDLSVPDSEEGAESEDPEAALMEAWLQRFGKPPVHFHSIPVPRRVHELPLVRREGALYELLLRRRTARVFDGERPMTAEQLSVLLWYAFGCHGYLLVGEDMVALRKTSPSGGALHPTEVYLLIVGMDGVEPGLYHYNTERHALELIEALTSGEAAELADEFTCGQGFTREAQVLFLLTARFYRSFWKYRRHKRAYAVLLMDAGHLSQTFYLVCTELGLGAFVTAAINGANIEERLGLDGFSEGALVVCGCGTPGKPKNTLEPQFLPYVPRETML
jgi:putative peptide maturation dehydrogenase